MEWEFISALISHNMSGIVKVLVMSPKQLWHIGAQI